MCSRTTSFAIVSSAHEDTIAHCAHLSPSSPVSSIGGTSELGQKETSVAPHTESLASPLASRFRLLPIPDLSHVSRLIHSKCAQLRTFSDFVLSKLRLCLEEHNLNSHPLYWNEEHTRALLRACAHSCVRAFLRAYLQSMRPRMHVLQCMRAYAQCVQRVHACTCTRIDAGVTSAHAFLCVHLRWPKIVRASTNREHKHVSELWRGLAKEHLPSLTHNTHAHTTECIRSILALAPPSALTLALIPASASHARSSAPSPVAARRRPQLLHRLGVEHHDHPLHENAQTLVEVQSCVQVAPPRCAGETWTKDVDTSPERRTWLKHGGGFGQGTAGGGGEREMKEATETSSEYQKTKC
eukprot:6207020-Pleurochrysis_carterae.AAC.3